MAEYISIEYLKTFTKRITQHTVRQQILYLDSNVITVVESLELCSHTYKNPTKVLDFLQELLDESLNILRRNGKAQIECSKQMWLLWFLFNIQILESIINDDLHQV